MPDISKDPEYVYQDVARAADYRSVLSVPMLRDGQPIGTITVYRNVARPFPDAQIDLLKTFADQAVIAIENVRLFTELGVRNRDLTTALDQRTATAEILRVISSSPTDVQPVFDAIVRSAVRCAARTIALPRDSTASCSSTGPPRVLARSAANRRAHVSDATGAGKHAGRTAANRAIVNLPDMLADPTYSRDFAMAGGWRSGSECRCFAMESSSEPSRSRAGAGRVSRSPGRAADHVRRSGVIAIENVRLFTELELAIAISPTRWSSRLRAATSCV
jgi:hypothetical protein